jgi:hypothetical protein
MARVEIAPVDDDRSVPVEDVPVGEEVVELALSEAGEEGGGEGCIMLLGLDGETLDVVGRQEVERIDHADNLATKRE